MIIINEIKSTPKKTNSDKIYNYGKESLKIQGQLSTSTKIIAKFTVLLVIIGAFQLIIFITQAYVLHKSLKATELAAKAADKSASLQKTVMLNTQRSFIFMKEMQGHATIDTKSKIPGQFILKAKLMNSANTPAMNAEMLISHRFFDKTTPDDKIVANISPQTREERIKAFIGPNISFDSPDIIINSKEATDIYNGTKRLFIWVIIEYNDMFEQTSLHHTKYCAEVFINYDPSHPMGNLPQDFFQFKTFWKYNSAD